MREVVKRPKVDPAKEMLDRDIAKKEQDTALSKIDLIGNSLTAAMHSGLGIASPFMREIFLKEKLPIVGMRYQGGIVDLLRGIHLGSRITFIREPENAYDQKAIMALDDQGRKVGYIPRLENAILSALMDAGKTMYGIVSYIPQPGELRLSGPPAVLYVDLYMREFAAPDDLSQIPLQGCRGSYVVMDLELTEDDRDAKIRSVFAIRVINGEERGILSEEAAGILPVGAETGSKPGTGSEPDFESESGKAPSDCYETLIRNLREAIGYLPVVLCDASGRQKEAMENGWGIYTGRPFSNQVIEISDMAKNHLHLSGLLSLDELVQDLRIEAEGDIPQEMRCRQIWQIYCRLDRSKLIGVPDSVSKELTRKKYQVGIDVPVSELRMTQKLRDALAEKEIDILWEVSVLDRMEAIELIGNNCISELEDLLQEAGSGFRPENCYDVLYGYPEAVKEIAEKKEEYWNLFLFFELFRFRYLQLEKVRKQNPTSKRHEKEGFPVKSRQVLGSILSAAMQEIRQWVQFYTFNLKSLNRESVREDDRECAAGIISAADALIRQYKEMMAFRRRFQYVDADESFRELIEETMLLGEQLCKCCVDDLYQKNMQAEKVLKDHMESGDRDTEPELDLSLNIAVDVDRINQMIEQLIYDQT